MSNLFRLKDLCPSAAAHSPLSWVDDGCNPLGMARCSLLGTSSNAEFFRLGSGPLPLNDADAWLESEPTVQSDCTEAVFWNFTCTRTLSFCFDTRRACGFDFCLAFAFVFGFGLLPFAPAPFCMLFLLLIRLSSCRIEGVKLSAPAPNFTLFAVLVVFAGVAEPLEWGTALDSLDSLVVARFAREPIGRCRYRL